MTCHSLNISFREQLSSAGFRLVWFECRALVFQQGLEELAIRCGRHQTTRTALVIAPRLVRCKIFQPTHTRPKLFSWRSHVQLFGGLKDASHLVKVGRRREGRRCTAVAMVLVLVGKSVVALVLCGSDSGRRSVLGDVLWLHARAIGRRHGHSLVVVFLVVFRVVVVTNSIVILIIDAIVARSLERRAHDL